jgi:APA family basic amino acid/polyamine antiporter
LILTSAKLIAFALIILGLYVGLKRIFSENFTNMWEASKTVVNPNGTITVTKLTGMAILELQAQPLLILSFLAMHGIM